MRIQKRIWQTYKHRDIPSCAVGCVQSWTDIHPDWDYTFHDDDTIADFIREYFPREIFEVFVSMPYGVMRSDFWRYAIIYTFGGIYADLDTVCKVHARTWMEDGKSFIVGLEHAVGFAQYFFAAKAGHPILERVISLIVERASDDVFKKENRLEVCLLSYRRRCMDPCDTRLSSVRLETSGGFLCGTNASQGMRNGRW